MEQFSKKLLRIAVIPAFAMAMTGAPVLASSYTELFPNPNLAEQDPHLRTVGWCGGNAGDPICQNRPGDINPNTDNDGGEGAVSVGFGQDGDRGFAFWSQKSIGADGFLFTKEFTFQTNEFKSLSWYQRDSEPSQLTRLALQVGDDWFVSQNGNLSTSSSSWEQFTVTDLAALNFVNYGNGGDLLPSGDAAGGVAGALPDGMVNAWGFAWDGRKSGTSRIDGIELHVDAAAVPLPPAMALMLAGLGGLGALRVRRTR